MPPEPTPPPVIDWQPTPELEDALAALLVRLALSGERPGGGRAEREMNT
jgi:hypothetical protein